jgi:hypothetical protein
MCINVRSIEWHQKTYHEISWDYPFKCSERKCVRHVIKSIFAISWIKFKCVDMGNKISWIIYWFRKFHCPYRHIWRKSNYSIPYVLVRPLLFSWPMNICIEILRLYFSCSNRFSVLIKHDFFRAWLWVQVKQKLVRWEQLGKYFCMYIQYGRHLHRMLVMVQNVVLRNIF